MRGTLGGVNTLTTRTDPSLSALAWRPLLWVAAARFLLPVASTLFAPIGYTPDEFYYLACADHLTWGYVDHPPFSIAVLGGVRLLLGDSLVALRLLPALCEALATRYCAIRARHAGALHSKRPTSSPR